MRRPAVFLMIYLLGALLTTRAASVYVVRVTNMKGVPEFLVMSKEELDQQDKLIRSESQVFSKAQLAAAKQWIEENKGKQYPGTRLTPRKLYVLHTFPTSEEADKKLTFYQDQEMRMLERKKDKDEERDKQRIEASKKAKMESVTKRRIEEEKKRDAEREALLDQSMDILQTKIQEILTGAPAQPPPAAEAKPEAKEDAKPEAKAEAKAEEKKEDKK